MNYKLFAIIFGVVVAVNGFAIPTGKNVHSEDLNTKESSVEHSHAEDQPAEDSNLKVQPLETEQKEDPPAQESQNEDSPALESQNEDSPALESQNEDSPVLESQNEDSPALESQNENSPVLESQNEDSPVLESQNEDSPALESQNENSPVVSQAAQDLQSENSPAQESQNEDSSTQESNDATSSEVNQPTTDVPAESQPTEDVHTENSLAEELPEEDLYEEDSESYVDVEAMKAVALGLNQFSTEFYKKLATTRPRNLVCSPLSVGVVLAMTAQGARGLTEQEMYRALHLPVDSVVTKHGYQSLMNSLNDDYRKVDLHLANSVFVTDEVELENEFENLIQTYFKSAVQKVTFQYPDEASDNINYWVDEQTDGNIKNIVSPADAYDAFMILVNAVYFKGSWKSRFQSENTKFRPFHVDKRHVKLVPTMYQKSTFNYGNLPGLNSVYIELPYESYDESDAVSMFVILPKEEANLKKVVNASEKIDFQKLHSHPKMTTVKLYMPKFKVRSTLSLQPILEKMGMHDMFKYKANFTGMVKDEPLSVSKVVQKAYIEVNEEGSEAAAASAAVVHFLTSTGKEESEPVEVSVDRPFMYAIYHRATNTVLFQGYVRSPALK